MMPKTAAFVFCACLFLAGCGERPEFTMVQITDIHYTSTPPRKTGISWKDHVRIMGYKLHNANLAKCHEILARAIEDIKERIKPDVVVITGDIVSVGDDKKGMKTVREMLNRLNCAYYPVIGDHDLNSGKDERSNYKEVFGKTNYSIDCKGWHIVFLGIYPADADLKWLEEDLDKNKGKHTIVCMHRMLVASPLMKKLAHVPLICQRADDVIATLNNYPNVAAVISGHSHTNYMKKKKNILYISTASLSEVPYEYRIIRVYKDRVTTTVTSVRNLKGI